MATKEELLQALKNADAAGDTQAATRFATLLKQNLDTEGKTTPKDEYKSAEPVKDAIFGGLESLGRGVKGAVKDTMGALKGAAVDAGQTAVDAGKSVVKEAIPMTAGMAAGAAAFPAGAAIGGAISGPAAPIGATVGGILTSLPASWAGYKAAKQLQDIGVGQLDKYAPNAREAAGMSDQQLAESQARSPVASMVAPIAAQVLGTRNIAGAGRTILSSLANRSAQAGVGVGVDVVSQGAGNLARLAMGEETQPFDLASAGLSAASGFAGAGKPTQLGQKLGMGGSTTTKPAEYRLPNKPGEATALGVKSVRDYEAGTQAMKAGYKVSRDETLPPEAQKGIISKAEGELSRNPEIMRDSQIHNINKVTEDVKPMLGMKPQTAFTDKVKVEIPKADGSKEIVEMPALQAVRTRAAQVQKAEVTKALPTVNAEGLFSDLQSLTARGKSIEQDFNNKSVNLKAMESVINEFKNTAVDLPKLEKMQGQVKDYTKAAGRYSKDIDSKNNTITSLKATANDINNQILAKKVEMDNLTTRLGEYGSKNKRAEIQKDLTKLEQNRAQVQQEQSKLLSTVQDRSSVLKDIQQKSDALKQVVPTKPLNTANVIDKVVELRESGHSNLNSPSSSSQAKGRAELAVASKLEEYMQTSLIKAGRKDAANLYKDKQVQIARAHAVESALTPDGLVNPQKLVNSELKGTFTGPLADITRYASHAKNSFSLPKDYSYSGPGVGFLRKQAANVIIGAHKDSARYKEGIKSDFNKLLTPQEEMKLARMLKNTAIQSTPSNKDKQ
ncbi:hypothetical protein UFOVP67_17 [uncultured Caudovirales phage]|uniref:Uncharacterized protein n=1 Tax=uncultured Caudovirales phage TaxID=2100421 RepID=A0A6J5T8T9_9CAUD|nr:hypothetical protein UFOVP67_17 [uncultured Caudovirales phage]